MTISPNPAPLPDLSLAHWAETTAATSRYLAALASLSDGDLTAPSLLPDWSRAHVVTHVARNADGLRNLLIWAHSGAETPQYPSWEQRNTDIDSGAGRGRVELLEDSTTAAERFAEQVSKLSASQWEHPVRTLKSEPFPARDVLRSRRTEVEVHHADLGIGYTAADWPTDFSTMLIERTVQDRTETASLSVFANDMDRRWQIGHSGGPQVTGTAADVAWWLIGRGDGSALASSAGAVPELTKWR